MLKLRLITICSANVEREIFDDPVQMQQLQQQGYTRLVSTKTRRPYALGETFSRVQSVMIDGDQGYGASDDTRFPECAVRAAEQHREDAEDDVDHDSYHTSLAGIVVAIVLSVAMAGLGAFLWSKTRS